MRQVSAVNQFFAKTYDALESRISLQKKEQKWVAY